MTSKPMSFNRILLAIGAVMLLLVGVHLGMRGLHYHPPPPEWNIPESDAAHGRALIQEFGCGACHTIPGIRGAKGRVGPQLQGFRNQLFIAGMLPNTPENLTYWIRHPRDVNPGTAMPDLQVTEEDARDIAAYLYGMR